MKECYVHLESLTECDVKKCFGKADLKNEVKIENHDDLNHQTYSDNVSQFIFHLFDILE